MKCSVFIQVTRILFSPHSISLWFSVAKARRYTLHLHMVLMHWASLKAEQRFLLTGHILAIMEWICLVLRLLSVSFSLKKKYTFASLGSVPSGMTWASTNMGSAIKQEDDLSSWWRSNHCVSKPQIHAFLNSAREARVNAYTRYL